MAKTQGTRSWTMVAGLGGVGAAIALGAMIITFSTLTDMARINGIAPAVLFPIIVDGTMVWLLIAATQLKIRGLGGTWLAYLGFAALSTVSVYANGAHALMTADMSRTTPLQAMVLGAIAPAALLIMTHMIMKLFPDDKERAKMQMRRAKLAAKVSTQSVPAAATPSASPRVRITEPSASTTVETSTPAQAVASMQQLRLVAPAPVVTVSDQEIAALIIEYETEHGTRPTGAKVGEWLGGKSAKTGQRMLKKLDEAGLLAEVPEPSAQLVGIG
ncbi:MAG: DUF2637 domain-containing protein [Leucobacter sp.]|nr:DUF2637 domain-containing protein [Leucobacter sp.]